jgi:GNAT superfamily N-acetyltransferase
MFRTGRPKGVPKRTGSTTRTTNAALGCTLVTLAAAPRPDANVKNDLDMRLAVPVDIPALTELIASSAGILSRGYYTESETESAIRYVFGVDSVLIADGTYFVAELDGAIAGCGGWSRRRTLYGGDQRPVGAQDLLDPASEPARIRAFFVSPKAVRRGVGRSLFAKCVLAAAASGFGSLELMATLPGVPFYLALGFNRIEEVTDVLPDGTPIRFVRMRRGL